MTKLYYIMLLVTIHEAKTHLSRLIKRALAGEEVIIAKGRTPLARIEPLREAASSRRLGGARGVVTYVAPDFNAPLDDFVPYSR